MITYKKLFLILSRVIDNPKKKGYNSLLKNIYSKPNLIHVIDYLDKNSLISFEVKGKYVIPIITEKGARVYSLLLELEGLV